MSIITLLAGITLLLKIIGRKNMATLTLIVYLFVVMGLIYINLPSTEKAIMIFLLVLNLLT